MKASHTVTRSQLAGMVVAAGVLLTAAPSSATVVCPPGNTNPRYCTNVPPTAVTGKATDVTGDSAVLNGVVGPNVANGDATTYIFVYGKSTRYGPYSPPRTLPPGPATQAVSYKVDGLVPCTTYHFRLGATNSDGMVRGNDNTFTTKFVVPIRSYKVPHSVRRGKRFKVTITLRTAAQVKVEVRRNGRTLHTYYEGYASGTIKQSTKITGELGKYQLRVVAKLACGSKTDTKTVKVR